MAKLKVQGSATGTGTVTLVAPTTDSTRTITLPDGDISLGVGIDDNATSTAITIDASENVSLVGSLRVKGQNLTHSANTMVIGQEGGGLTQFCAYGSDASTEGAIQFITRSSDGSINGESVRITTDGLTFNGDTAAANALDDYETGTWTPALAATTTNPSVTYGHQYGYYTKIGRMVHLTFNVRAAAVTNGGSGYVKLSGIPFTSSALVNQRWAGSVSYNNMYIATGKDLTPIINNSNSTVGFNYSNNNTNINKTVSLTAPVTSGGYIQGSVYYMTD